MIVRGAGEGFNLIVPMRRIIRWLDTNDMLWIIDPKAKMPTMEQIKDIPVEGVIEGDDDDKAVNFNELFPNHPELIRTLPFTIDKK